MARHLFPARITLAFVIACSSGTGARTRSPRGEPPPDAAIAPATSPTEAECEALFAHAIALEIAEQRRTLPPEQVPTEAEQTALRDELRSGFLAECRAGSREGYECAMAATTTAELGACHSTRSSSTSNSSVAPGGMTPAAPRSP